MELSVVEKFVRLVSMKADEGGDEEFGDGWMIAMMMKMKNSGRKTCEKRFS